MLEDGYSQFLDMIILYKPGFCTSETVSLNVAMATDVIFIPNTLKAKYILENEKSSTIITMLENAKIKKEATYVNAKDLFIFWKVESIEYCVLHNPNCCVPWYIMYLCRMYLTNEPFYSNGGRCYSEMLTAIKFFL